MRVLFVVDNLNQSSLVSNILTEEGHQVEIATNIKGAITMLDYFNPEIIFLDLAHLYTEGVEFVEEARHNRSFSNTPVWAFTTPSNAAMHPTSVEMWDNFISKPVLPSTLRQLFRRHLPIKMAQKHLF
jgi:DNA-binding response OmpR family regulator